MSWNGTWRNRFRKWGPATGTWGCWDQDICVEEFLPSIPSNPGLKRDEDQHQNMQNQDMDMENQDTDTGRLGLGEVGRKRDTRGPGSEGIRIQENMIVTWR